MTLHGAAVDAGVTGDRRGVGDLRVLAGRDLQEAGEGPEVAGQRFCLHFLHQVGLRVRAQAVLRVLADDLAYKMPDIARNQDMYIPFYRRPTKPFTDSMRAAES